MTNPMLDWVCDYLARDEEIVVPIRKMWNAWRAEHPESTLETFETTVLADPRITAVSHVDQTEGMEFASEAEREAFIREFEALGYYHGPRVKLKSREVTYEHVTRMLQKYTDRMIEALWAAHETRPIELTSEQERQLMDLIAAAKQMQRDLQEAAPSSDQSSDQAETDETSNQ